MIERLGDLLHAKAFRFAVAGIVVIAGVFVAINVTKGSATYPIKAVYASAPGLFPGAAVDVLGVPVGTVTAVTNVDDHVDVTLRVHTTTRIPSDVEASLVSPELLGQPDVDLNPGYTTGPHLKAGATIPQSHTSIPVSTDELLKELQRTLKAINPQAVGDLITNLSQDLDGQGAALNSLIASAAGTIQLLAQKGDDLGQLNGTLAQLTGTLDSDTAQIQQLVQQYDTVSTVIAQHSGQLNDAITQLTGATTSLVTLLTPNLQPLEADVGVVTTAGRTLDRNIDTVDEILAQANNLFQGAKRAIDPNYNWLDLNAALPVGVTGDYVAGLIRDRLAGVCRRIVANHSTGLSASVLASLNSCGNPNSTFFDPLLNDIPTILNTLSGSSVSSTATGLLQQGLNEIGKIAGSSVLPSGTPVPPAVAPTSAAPPSTPTTTTTTTPSKNSVCGLLGALLNCHASTQHAKVNLAANQVDAPSLTAPAASLLPSLRTGRHPHRAHRGLLAGWVHDVGSWF